MYTASVRYIAITAILLTTLSFPFVSSAQASEDLQATIRASILADPRAAALPPEEFEQLVGALTAEATRLGVTADDILRRPDAGDSFIPDDAPAASVCETNSILCKINAAFGFSGDDYTIPIWIGISSALLILLLGAMLEVHHRKHARPQEKLPGDTLTYISH